MGSPAHQLHAARLPVIGLIVPALAAGGGVPAVADFLCTQIERTGLYALKVFSLATSSRDTSSLRLVSPRTWLDRPTSSRGRWQGREFAHVGAIGVEFEFRRVAPNALLRAAIEDCDLIQVVSGSAAPALTLTGCNKPLVLQVATRAVVERRRARSVGFAARVFRKAMITVIDRCDDRALRIADAVMVENEWMLRHACGVLGAGSGRVWKAPPGIDVAVFNPSAERALRLRRDPYFLFVGRLADPRKNIELLCRAYALLFRQILGAPRLVIAGHGTLPAAARAILEQASLLDHVDLVGAPSADRLRRLYQEATSLIVTSDEEGFGMVVIEAMACGTPVVSTRCGGPEEIITHGVDGFLVPLDDAGQLAAQLRLLCIPERASAMGAQARRTVLSRFSAEVAIQPFLQVYRQLLS